MDFIANLILALIVCLLGLVQPVAAMSAGDVIALLLGTANVPLHTMETQSFYLLE